MAVSMTVRVDKALKAQLSTLSELKKAPVNKLIVQALIQYVSKETIAVQEELERSLAKLRKYREADPDFEQAIDDIVMAELSTGDDPAQGKVEFKKDSEATARVRSLLNA